MMKASQQQLAEAVDQSADPFVFFEARSQISRFGFDVLPVGILTGHYSKSGLPFMPVSKADTAIQKQVMKMAEQVSDGK